LTRSATENREKSIDLKCVVKQIKIEAAFIYIQKITNVKRNKLLNISTNNNEITLKEKKNAIDTKVKPFDDSVTINIQDVIDDKKIYLKDAMLMFIPIKNGSKKKWIILFPELEKLSYWLKNIEKWVKIFLIKIYEIFEIFPNSLLLLFKASIPKIEIFYASDGDVHDDDDSKSSANEDTCAVFKSIKHEKGRRFSLFKINSTPTPKKNSRLSI
jgi:hypothetical protein